MSIENSKVLGGVGAILMLVGMIPYSYLPILALVGLILVMIALYNLAKYYSEGRIFNNSLYGLIVGIVGSVVSMITVIATVLTSLTDLLYEIFPGWNGDWQMLPGMIPDWSNITLDTIAPFIVGMLAVFAILWVSAIIAAFFVRRSLGSLAAKSGVALFATAGLLMFIGALLIVLFGIGLIIIWVSVLLIAIAFFRIRTQELQPTASASTPT